MTQNKRYAVQDAVSGVIVDFNHSNFSKEALTIDYALYRIGAMEYSGETEKDYEEVKDNFESYDAYMDYYYGDILNHERSDQARYEAAVRLLSQLNYEIVEITEEEYLNGNEE